jgi:hypothetical protein
MSIDALVEVMRMFVGVIDLAPAEGSAFPEVAWGDHFFYYAPDGRRPSASRRSPLALRELPEDTFCDLGQPDR